MCTSVASIFRQHCILWGPVLIHLMCSSFYLLYSITCTSQHTHFHSGYFQWFIARLYEHPCPHLRVSVQCSRVYRKMCTVSILLETLKWISEVCKSFLTSSLNLDVVRGFVFPRLGGKVNSDIDCLPVLILHQSENLICLLAVWIFHLWSTFFISYVHFLFGLF